MDDQASEVPSPSESPGSSTKSKIEALAAQGVDYADIARRLGIRYQHVHNVLGNKKNTVSANVFPEYRAARAMFDRCFIGDGSFLWPDRSVWSVGVIQSYIDAIKTSQDVPGAFYDRLEGQLSGQPADVFRLACDLLALYYFFPDWVRQETKAQNIRRVAAWGIPDDPPDAAVLESSFGKGIGGVGTHYFAAQAYELLYFAYFALDAKVQNVNLADPAAAQQLADQTLEKQHDSTEARNLVLHLLFPELYEPIVSKRHKKMIAEAFHDLNGGAADEDGALRAIRQALSPKFGDRFSFYDPKVKPLWDPAASQVGGDVSVSDAAPNVVASQTYSLSDLQRDTLWPEERLGDLLEALDGPLPVVLAGPPGTGKTWVAKRIVRFLTGDDPKRCRIVQFHPSFAYEQFMEGLQPVLDDGTMTFKAVPGVVVQMAQEIEGADPNHYLIIDEMNRANLPRVMGELMYLLEYRDESIQLPYTGKFSLPRNLRFIGTMNTADRSIRSIDVALRRRFEMFSCNPDAAILERYYRSHRNTVPDLIVGFNALNAWLTEELDNHHTIGHTFFMFDILTLRRMEQVWDRQLKPLLNEYFFDQPGKVNALTPASFWPSISP